MKQDNLKVASWANNAYKRYEQEIIVEGTFKELDRKPSTLDRVNSTIENIIGYAMLFLSLVGGYATLYWINTGGFDAFMKGLF